MVKARMEVRVLKAVPGLFCLLLLIQNKRCRTNVLLLLVRNRANGAGSNPVSHTSGLLLFQFFKSAFLKWMHCSRNIIWDSGCNAFILNIKLL